MYKLANFFNLYPKSIWCLTFIELIFISRKTIFAVSRDVGDYSTALDSSTSLALLGIFISFLYICNRRNEIKNIHKIMGHFLLFYYFSALSFVWAGNTSTILFKASEVIVNIYIICLIVIELTKYCDFKKTIYYIIIFCLLITYIDAVNVMRITGVMFFHTNSYTFTSMISCLLCLGCLHLKLFKLRELKWCLILSLMAVVGGTSTATYASFLIGVLILYSSNEKGINLIRVFIVTFICYVGYSYFYDIIYDFIRADHSDQEMKSMTGRNIIWEACMLSFQQHPILGSGFVVGERNLNAFTYSLSVLSTHNSFLSALVNSGIIGFSLFTYTIIVWAGNLLLTARKNILATLLYPVAIAIIVNCNSCPAIGSDWGHVSSCVYLILAISSSFIRFGKRDNKHL